MVRAPELTVVPLGGCGEIGRNMSVLSYDGESVAIDCGISFPEEEMLGVDLVLPDVSYITDGDRRLLGLLITHGHEDHVGAIPYLLPRLGNPPIYATRLTMGLIEVKLREHKLIDSARLHVVHPGDVVELGPFRAEFFRMSHSIPDAAAIAVRTPIGTVFHSGDYKFDHTPVGTYPTDFGRLAELGREGVLLFMGDSTRIESSGYTPSERVITATFDRVFADAPGRIIISTFASLISRIQQVLDTAKLWDRKVAFVGRSMVNNVTMSLDLGYLHAEPDLIITVDDLRKMPDEHVVVMTTGAQGEPTSGLTRMANGDHRQIAIKPGDTVVISASPIPGNATLIARTINNLFRLGANVLYHGIADVHVSGHAAQEEQKLLMRLLNPKFFMPIHGEYRHLALHKRLAEQMGIPPENVIVAEDGDIVVTDGETIKREGHTSAGYVFVDGLGVGDVGEVVLRDRRVLSQDGIAIVVVTVDKQTGRIIAGPDLISRGFVYVRESGDLIEDARQHVLSAMASGGGEMSEWNFVQTRLKEVLSRFLYDRTRRRPMILPVVMEV